MELISYLVVFACGLVVILGVGFILMLILARLKWQFTRIETGNTVFIVQGDALDAIWPNVGGYKMSNQEDPHTGRHWLVKVPTKNNAGIEKREEEIEKEVLDAFFYKTPKWIKWLAVWLWKKLGIRYVGITWPQKRVHRFDIRHRDRLLEGKAAAGKSLQERIDKSDEPTKVDSLLFRVPRPIFIDGIELAGDNSKINLLCQPVYEQIIPAEPVFYLKGDFFTLLDAAIEAALIDFGAYWRVAIDDEGELIDDEYDPNKFELPIREKDKDDKETGRYEKVEEDIEIKDKTGKLITKKRTKERKGYLPSHLTFKLWLKLKKGEGSVIEKHLRHINISPEYYKKLEDKKRTELTDFLELFLGGKPQPAAGEDLRDRAPHGIIPRYGFGMASFRLIGWEPHPLTEGLATALRDEQTFEAKAKGVRKEAYGERDRVRAVGEADASRLGSMVQTVIVALKSAGVPEREIGQAVSLVFQAEQLKQIPNLQTLILGNTPVMPTIPAGAGAKT